MSEEPPKPPVADPDPVDPKPDDTVAYETHRKLLGEKKKLTEKHQAVLEELEALKGQVKSRETKELEEKEEYKKLWEQSKAERDELNNKLSSFQQEQTNSRKLRSFLNTLDGKVAEKWWGHIDLDKILVNPDTGAVDEMSVTKYVEQFQKEYPEIIVKQKDPPMPSPAPGGNPSGPSSLKDQQLELANLLINNR